MKIGGLRLVVAVLGMIWLSSAESVFAEGRCPPGQYPVGSANGVLGCAPIPGAAGTPGDPSAPALPPSPTGRWHSTWGAISHSEATSSVGVSTGLYSESDAKEEADRKCQAEGARDCAVILTYANQCAAWLVPQTKTSGSKSGVASGKTLSVAKNNAKQQCIDSGGKRCTVFYSDCTKPEFEKF
ncbi:MULTISPECIES: DUF4189 domain-containing protein [Stenotrophomonas]|uniref:DUF4189 domain-containing protein n=1 Tax=Stenotrophomonas TaxID=40323 RepID=UPI0034317BED